MSLEKVFRALLSSLVQQQQQNPGHFLFPHNAKNRYAISCSTMKRMIPARYVMAWGWNMRALLR